MTLIPSPSTFRAVRYLLLLPVVVIVILARAVAADRLPDLDHRPQNAAEHRNNDEQTKNARQRLTGQFRDLTLDFDSLTGSPRWISARGEFLSGPGGVGKAVTPQAHRGIAPNDKHKSIKAFLNEHAAIFRHDARALDQARIIRDFSSDHNGLQTTVWEQMHEGIPIFDAVLIGHTTADGKVVNISSLFVANPAAAGKPALPPISARKSIVFAAENVGEQLAEADLLADPKPSSRPESLRFIARQLKGSTDIRLVWFPVDEKTLRLAWDTTLTLRKSGLMYRVVVAADNGEVLLRHCLTSDISDASYRVYTSDSPSPFSPGPPSPLLTNQPPYVLRSLVVTAALNTNASPNGWINDGVNETLGNNVDAHLDRNADELPDLPRPHGSPNRVFDFPLDLAQSPQSYADAAVVNAFYWCNWYHDKMYEFGFTEAAGNFQMDNFGRGGVGGDAVIADVQDGSEFNNAHFNTPLGGDGMVPRLTLTIFTAPNPDRDCALDAEMILHENTHGLSNRRVGGGAGITKPQSGGLGEGWSDFYALSLLSEPGDNINGNYAFAGYSSFQLSNQMDNFYFGIRRYPYSTDMTRNPLTFKDIDQGQRSLHPGIPISSVFALLRADEVHAQGEVWCSALWEARANFISKYGFATGNRSIIQLVTDGMNLSPPDPTFIEARDAILQADLINNGGANFHELWQAFAKRGIGYSASCPPNFTTAGVHEAFDLPDELFITPTSIVIATGPPEGPFAPLNQSYSITNFGGGPIGWSVTKNVTWLSLSSESGTVIPGGSSASVMVTINNKAALLPVGVYNAILTFSNQVSSRIQQRQFTLRIGQPDYLTEVFSTSDNDLSFKSWTFVPDGSGSFYSVCREPATAFPVDPRNGKVLHLEDDSFTNITLVGSSTVSLYGRSTNIFFIGSNGYITFGSGDQATQPDPSVHFSKPRISALLDDLNPLAGGTVSWQQLADRAVVTFKDVPEYSSVNRNNFQIEMFYDGVIRLTYLLVEARGGIVGLSDGSGAPSSFTESDFSSYPSCSAQLLVQLPSNLTEGTGTLTGAGQILLPFPAASNITVSLKSSDTSELVIPDSVIVPAGQSNAFFNLTLPDDTLLDGSQLVSVTAVAAQYLSAQTTLLVHDNDIGTLSLSFPTSISESAGSLTGNLTLGSPAGAEVTVQLTSSDPARLSVPGELLVPAGASSLPFTISVVNNNRIEGNSAVTVTAHVQNWVDGVRTAQIIDDEQHLIALTVVPEASEAAGIIPGAGRISLPGVLSTNLGFSLSAANDPRLTVPSSLILPAGQSNLYFNITTVNNTAADGPGLANLMVQAPGFSSAAANVRVIDDETPSVPSNPSPADLSTGRNIDVDLTWTGSSDGFPTTYKVYFSISTNLGAAQLIGSTPTPLWHVGNLAPNTTYYWSVAAERSGRIQGPIWQFTTATADHYLITHEPGPRLADEPFSVTITAKDPAGHTVSNFAGALNLSALAGPDPVPVLTEDFEQGRLIGWITNSAGASISDFTAADGSYALILSGGPGDGISRKVPSLRPGRITFAVRPCAAAGGGGTFLLSATETLDSAVALFEITGQGTMGIEDAFGGSYFIPYESNRWYRIQLDFDWTGQNLDFSVNGAVIEQNIPFRTAEGTAINFLSLYNQADGVSGWDSISFVNDFSAKHLTITPSIATNFVNGVWTGSLAIHQPELSSYLKGIDAAGHSSVSDRFDVTEANDISLEVVTSSDLLVIGDEMNYTARILNSGPYPATDVQFHTDWSASVAVLSAFSPSGSCANGPNGVDCSLPTIPPGASVFVSIVISHDTAGLITNTASISRPAADGNILNNTRITIVDTISAPSFSFANLSLVEGDSGQTNVTFNLLLDRPGNYPITVDYTTAPITADAGADFIATTGSITLMPGVTNVPVAVPVINDLIREQNETFSLIITRVVHATLSNSQATATIIDNNDPAPSLSIGDIIVTEPASGVIAALFPVTLSLPSGVPIQVNFATADGTGTAGIDYFATNGVLTIPAGQTNASISVLVKNDPFASALDWFFLNLSIPINASIARPQGRCLILEQSAPPCVSISGARVGESDNGGDAIAWFTVSLSSSNSQPVLVNYHTQNGTATADVDYVAMDGTISFSPGETTVLIPVSILDDFLNETDETFSIVLSDPINCSLCITQAVATIVNDDPLPAVIAQSLSLPEGNVGWTTGFVQVTLSAPSGRPVSVDYASANGTASSGLDYLAASGTFTFAPGVTSVSIPVAVRGDISVEPDETFRIQLLRATNAFVLTPAANITISDDDGTPGILNHFDFNTVPSPVAPGANFPVSIQARDAFGAVASSFNGLIELDAYVMSPDVIIGSGTSAVSQPMSAFFASARAQLLYLHSELGDAATFRSLGFDIIAPPGQVLSNFTVRLKHTGAVSYSQTTWDNAGWTTVCQTNLNVSSNGWFFVPFSTFFDYNGTDNLLIDITFADSGWSFDGLCRSTATAQPRMLALGSDLPTPPPINWSSPQPGQLYTYLPNIRLKKRMLSLPLSQNMAGPFANGTWSGNLQIPVTATNAFLSVDDANGHSGTGNLFDVSNTSGLFTASISIVNGFARLSWPSVPGRMYRVEFRNNLNTSGWTPLPGGDLLADSNTSSRSDTTAGLQQRFYRIVLLP